MKVIFNTNIDCCKGQTWPTLDHPPQIGSYVEDKRGVTLKVVSVTYGLEKDLLHPGHYNSVCHVELHLGPYQRTIPELERFINQL